MSKIALSFAAQMEALPWASEEGRALTRRLSMVAHSATITDGEFARRVAELATRTVGEAVAQVPPQGTTVEDFLGEGQAGNYPTWVRDVVVTTALNRAAARAANARSYAARGNEGSPSDYSLAASAAAEAIGCAAGTAGAIAALAVAAEFGRNCTAGQPASEAVRLSAVKTALKILAA